ncbi:SpoIIE family protein phosphatase [Nonomuraea sp. NPDC050310]|uniref:SpoIIE family protein phosphatase n=1 Tax=unclassified Nonomuraea TaxID=2593643 RepID=UPI0033DC8506
MPVAPTPREAGSTDPRAGTVGRLAATIERLRREIQEAQLAAEGRALIELARGILVERLRCGPTQAAQQLASLAAQAGTSQLELAAEIINQTSQDRLSDTIHEFLTQAGVRDTSDPSVGVRLRAAESGMLHAGDSQMVAESLLEHALTPLGASLVALWVAGPDASLTLAGVAGISTEEARRWRYVPPGVSTPARRALVERQSVWFRSLNELSLPSIGYRDCSGGRVVVPAGTGGRIFGVLEIGWTGPLEPQPPAVRKQVEALAELCARTLEDPDPPGPPAPGMTELVDLADALPDPALVLRPELAEDGTLADFRIHHVNRRFIDPAGRPRGSVTGSLLLEAYPLASGDSGLFEKIDHVHATGEPFSADAMPLTELVDQVPLTTVADISLTRHGECVLLIWRVQDEAVRLASLLQHAQRLGRLGGFEEIPAIGRITWSEPVYALYGLSPSEQPVPLERLREHAHPDDGEAIDRFLRTILHRRMPAATAFRLEREDGIVRHIRVVAEPAFDAEGRMIAIRGAYQDISSQHWTEVALAATRDQLAVTEEESQERNRLALQLQHAIMPPARGPVEAFGLNIAVRYRPAEAEHLVGGDWYDTVVLPSKQVLLSVGDVAGHGIEAATGMVTLRNALRGLAATGAGPGQLLGWLNMVTHHLTESVTATAVCALFDPESRILRWARAGHLPPVLVREAQSLELPAIDGLLLGAIGDAEYAEGQVQLEEGDTLLIYTDGLIERRDRTLQHSQRQLLEMARRATGGLDQRLDYLLTHCISDTDDDTCLIGVQLV